MPSSRVIFRTHSPRRDKASKLRWPGLERRCGACPGLRSFHGCAAKTHPMNLPTFGTDKAEEGFACDRGGYHAVLAVKAVARASPRSQARLTRGPDGCAAA